MAQIILVTMNRFILFIPLIFLLLCFGIKNEKNPYFPDHFQKTYIAKLKPIDSLCYYQCYCLKISKQKYEAENGTIIDVNASPQPITITEKFMLYKNNDTYRMQHYVSSATYYPNKKFAFLKLVEKDYWNFVLKHDTVLPKQDVLLLAAYETKLQSLTAYDFTVVDNNSPQCILNGKKVSEQYRVSGDHLLNKTLSVFK